MERTARGNVRKDGFDGGEQRLSGEKEKNISKAGAAQLKAEHQERRD